MGGFGGKTNWVRFAKMQFSTDPQCETTVVHNSPQGILVECSASNSRIANFRLERARRP
jgi:hypothetical protein